MKQFIYLLATSFIFFSCQQAAPLEVQNVKMETFKKNVETTKAWLAAFSENDSLTFFSDEYISEDFLWSPPGVGMDSISKEEWKNAFRFFMTNYDNKQLTKPQYFAALDEENQPDGNVRVYGEWNSNFAATGKKSKLKWYAVFRFDEQGRIKEQMEWYDSADLSKEFD